MLDINLFREDKGGDPELIKLSQKKRGASMEIVDDVIALDTTWRSARFTASQCSKSLNALQKEITTLIKNGKKEQLPPLLEEKKKIEEQRIVLEKEADDLEEKINKKLMSMGNIVHQSVVVSMDERDNKVERMWWPVGERTETSERTRREKLVSKDGKGAPGLFSHHEVLNKIKGYDQNRGTNVAGHRGYFLMNAGVDLNLALVRYGLDFLENKEYTKLQTPFFMRKEVMAKTAQLEEFDEALYKIDGGEEEGQDNSKYMIATSEQPISAFHMNEWFSEPEKELPKKYAGYSTCFRKEAGAHGKETWGIFRVHQFEKIEQFIITDTEKSWEMHEEMMRISEEFYQNLGLPYRVISIVSGALNNAAAKKYDLEAWFPFQAEYKELVSCSNCTDYQSRRLEIRVGQKKLNDLTKKYAHCLNGTLCATERTLCCLLENYQTEEGVVIPEVLRPYMNGKSFIPFAPVEEKVKPVCKKNVTDGVKDMTI